MFDQIKAALVSIRDWWASFILLHSDHDPCVQPTDSKRSDAVFYRTTILKTQLTYNFDSIL